MSKVLAYRSDGKGSPIVADDGFIGGDKNFDELMGRVFVASMGVPSITEADWAEVLKFIKENLMTDERIQREYDSGYATGAENATKTIQRKMNEIAGSLFIANKDAEAKSMRDLGKEIVTWTKK